MARTGNAERGQQAYATAQCIKCHRFGRQGEPLGPDLTNVAKRFQKKEILESIVYPSHVVSDQYATQIVVANGRTYSGVVVPRGKQGVTMLLSDGEKIELSNDVIDEAKSSAVSVMPTGLLNSLSLEQVGDLFAYLGQDVQPSVAQKQPAEKK